MSISSRITEIEQHIGNAYNKIEDLGIDLTDVDKNIDNIATMLEDVWDEYPKVTATDVEEATINGTKKGRMEIDLKGQTSQGVLPTEYQQVEYIENTGSSYIDIGKILTQNNSFEFKMKSPEVLGNETSMNCGSRSGASSNNISSNFQGNNLTVDFNNSNYTGYRASYSMQPSTIYKVYSSKLVRKISDENDNVLASNTNVCNDTIRTPNTCTIFKINPAPQTYWLYARTKLYYFKIWENDELVINLVPCYRKADNEIGMYDTITNTFLTNQGTDIFVKGNDVPNPDYLQQIKNVTGQANVKIQNKNLFTSEWVQGEINSTTGIIGPSNTSIATDNFIEVKPNTRYSMSRTIATAYMNVRGYDENKNYIGTGNLGKVITTIIGSSNANPMQANEDFCVIEIQENIHYLKFNDLSNDLSTKYMMVEGQYTAETIPEYVPHEEQNLPFTFAEGQRAMQETQLLDDGIHQKRKQRVLNGTETGWMQNSYATKENTVGFYILLNNIALKNTGELGYLCDKFMAIPASNWSTDIQGVVQMNDKTLLFKINKSSLITENVAGFKTWLSSNNITVEYTLETEEIIPYNSTQQSQYNAIKQAKSYDDTTIISSESDELGFNIDVESLANANNMISIINSRLDLLEG